MHYSNICIKELQAKAQGREKTGARRMSRGSKEEMTGPKRKLKRTKSLKEKG